MEPEAVWLPDAVDIKQEPHDDVKEELTEDETGGMEFLPLEIKQELQECQLKHEDNNLIMAGTSGVFSSSGNNSMTIANFQHERISKSDVSETDEDTSQQKEVDLCSYSCEFCNIKFNTLFQLQEHSIIHEDVQSATIAFESDRSTGQLENNNGSNEIDYRHICNICYKSFTLRGNLLRHMKIHTDQRPFTCEVCNKSFRRRGHLNAHMKTHTSQQPFSCEICNTSFSKRGILKTHMKTHTGYRPFSCEICNKSFTEHVELITHMRTCQRLFSCKVCNKSFSTREILKTHVGTHIHERLFYCGTCNKSFTRRKSLQRHKRTHTGEEHFLSIYK